MSSGGMHVRSRANGATTRQRSCRLCNEPAGLKLHAQWASTLAAALHFGLRIVERAVAPIGVCAARHLPGVLAAVMRLAGVAIALLCLADVALLLAAPVLFGATLLPAVATSTLLVSEVRAPMYRAGPLMHMPVRMGVHNVYLTKRCAVQRRQYAGSFCSASSGWCGVCGPCCVGASAPGMRCEAAQWQHSPHCVTPSPPGIDSAAVKVMPARSSLAVCTRARQRVVALPR